MRAAQHIEVLAEAAAGLSQQLQAHLTWMAAAMKKRLPALEKRFRQRLKELSYTKQQCESLVMITPGAAAAMLVAGKQLGAYLEEVQYRGRRLAKLGLTPASVVSALREYDVIVEEEISRSLPAQAANLAWARNQLHFLAVLSLNTSFYQVREAESHAFYELFRAEVESHTLLQMLPRFLAVLSEYTGAQAARLYLLKDPGVLYSAASLPRGAAGSEVELNARLQAAVSRPRSVLMPGPAAHVALDPAWLGKYRTCWSVPLLAEDRLQGVLQFAFHKNYHWLPREHDLLKAAAERCWMAADKARLLEDLASREEQVRRLAAHMVEVEEAERRRISRELHDEAGQSLLCVRLQMEMLEQDLPGEMSQWRNKLSEVRVMTEHTIIEIRRLIAALSPAILEQMGLAAALRQLVGRFRTVHSAEVHIQIPRKLDLPKRVEIIVYRLVQEILNNIAKYSLASRVNLLLDSADGYLRLHVEDNGIGFDVDEAFARHDCFGLSGLRERVALMGGTLEVRSLRKDAPGGRSTTGSGAEKARLAGTAGMRSDRSQKQRQVGIDRHGTAIWVELPLDGRGDKAPRRAPRKSGPAQAQPGGRTRPGRKQPA